MQPYVSVRLFEVLNDRAGQSAQNMRLYMLPGVGHCLGGVDADSADHLVALVHITGFDFRLTVRRERGVTAFGGSLVSPVPQGEFPEPELPPRERVRANQGPSSEAMKPIRNPDSAPGDWYVDTACIDCRASRNVAPNLIAERSGKSVFTRQPTTPDERLAAWRAVLVHQSTPLRRR